MDIKYYYAPEKGKVYAVGTNDSEYAEGIDPVIASEMVKLGLVSRDELCVPRIMKSVASCQAPDVFDPEKGKAIARDKLLSRYYRRMVKALTAYRVGLNELIEANDSRVTFCFTKADNAQHRLDDID